MPSITFTFVSQHFCFLLTCRTRMSCCINKICGRPKRSAVRPSPNHAVSHKMLELRLAISLKPCRVCFYHRPNNLEGCRCYFSKCGKIAASIFLRHRPAAVTNFQGATRGRPLSWGYVHQTHITDCFGGWGMTVRDNN